LGINLTKAGVDSENKIGGEGSGIFGGSSMFGNSGLFGKKEGEEKAQANAGTLTSNTVALINKQEPTPKK